MREAIYELLVALLALAASLGTLFISIFKTSIGSILLALFGAVAAGFLGWLFPALAGSIITITTIAPYQWGLMIGFVAFYFRKKFP